MDTPGPDRSAETLRRRFVPLSALEEMFAISRAQAYALVRTGEIRAIQVGGRHQWRIEVAELEAYIERATVNIPFDVDIEGS